MLNWWLPCCNLKFRTYSVEFGVFSGGSFQYGQISGKSLGIDKSSSVSTCSASSLETLKTEKIKTNLSSL